MNRDEECGCDGCWACAGHEPGCPCTTDTETLYDEWTS